MTSKMQRTPGLEAPSQAPDATARATNVEALLRQYVERMQETGAAPHVMEMQERVSTLAKTLAESEAQPVYRRKFSPAPGVEHNAVYSADARSAIAAGEAHADYRSYFYPAPEPDRYVQTGSHGMSESPRARTIPPKAPDAREDMARDWLEKRFQELRHLIKAGTSGNEIRNSNAVIEQRIEEILERLNGLQARSAGEGAGEAVGAQLQRVAERLDAQQNHHIAQGAALQHIDAKLDKIGHAARLSVSAAENAAVRAEAAVVDAANKSSRQTFELTARHLTEALKQTAPAARFAGIENEVRSLNLQSRETGQRTTRALEEVHLTLRQFLEQVSVAPQATPSPRRAGLTVPVNEAPAAERPEAAARRAPMQPHASPSAAAPQRREGEKLVRPAYSGAKDDEYEQESSRRVRTGLVIGVLIMLVASVVLLCINLLGSKPAFSLAGEAQRGVKADLTELAWSQSAWTTVAETTPSSAEWKVTRVVSLYGAGTDATAVSISDTPPGYDREQPGALYLLGAQYERGRKVRRDLTQAAIWYERAALRGHALAMHNLGVLQTKRSVRSANYAEAFRWFEKAAARGVVDSQYNLAVLLERGLGRPVDLAKAYRWYAVAAKGGDVEGAAKREQLRAILSQSDLTKADRFVDLWKPNA